MLKLPKVNKGLWGAPTQTKKVQRVIAGAALAVAVVLASVPSDDVRAASAPPAPQTVETPGGGALLLAPPGQPQTIIADHESHSSHYSHRSHFSHYSSQ
jgi:hypothetical protein